MAVQKNAGRGSVSSKSPSYSRRLLRERNATFAEPKADYDAVKCLSLQ